MRKFTQVQNPFLPGVDLNKLRSALSGNCVPKVGVQYTEIIHNGIGTQRVDPNYVYWVTAIDILWESITIYNETMNEYFSIPIQTFQLKWDTPNARI